MLLRSLPDLGACSAESRQTFQGRWGRENFVIWGRTRLASFPSCAHPLSIRAAWGGAEQCVVGNRTIAVDDDSFLILNNGRICATKICAPRPVESFAICFRPGLVERAYAAMVSSVEAALANGTAVIERDAEFAENLQPHDQTVTPVLRFIKAHLLAGVDDESWYEEQLHFLLERMLTHRTRTLEHIDSLRLSRPATRREVYRRISIATDYLQSNYSQELNLDELARVAYLSKYHFLRLFTLVHRITPYAFLQRKRITVALRLLESTPMSALEVASHAGFSQRQTLFREIRRWTGLTPMQIRSRLG